jgi:hypothetical protein
VSRVGLRLMGDQRGLAALLARLEAATGITLVSASEPHRNRGADGRSRVYVEVDVTSSPRRR